MCRTFDIALAECCHAEGVGMLAYSPLAMGLLTVRLSPATLSRCTVSAQHLTMCAANHTQNRSGAIRCRHLRPR